MVPSVLVFLVIVIVVLAIFSAAAARRVVANLAFTGGGLWLRLLIVWVAAMLLHTLISLVPMLASYDGRCRAPGGGQESCGWMGYLIQTIDGSLHLFVLFFGLYFLAVLAGGVTGLMVRHRKLAPKSKRF